MTNSQNYKQKLYSSYITYVSSSTIENIKSDLNSRKPYIEKLIKDLIPYNKDVSILDIGCGHGAFLYFLKEKGYKNLKGLDISHEQVSMAHELGLNNVSHSNLLEDLPKLPEKSYDVIIAFDIIEHFTKDEIFKILESSCKILKSGGKLILHIPNGEAIFSGRIFHGDFTHEACFTRSSLKQILTSCNFSNISFYEDKPIVHGVKSLIRSIIWFISRNIFRLIYMAETGNIGEDLVLSSNILCVCQKCVK
jgi:cyclopropane fatty-acyl-phospholipid synthase-like methyltransferase